MSDMISLSDSTTTLEKTPARSATAADVDNPFITGWETPYGAAPFPRIRDQHYLPAFEHGIAEQRANVEAIRSNAEPPSFENTIKALELACPVLMRVMDVFRNIVGTDANETLQAVQAEIIPRLTRENDVILHDEKLFQRIRAVHAERDRLGLDVEDARLLELTYEDFVRAGAALDGEAKTKLAAVNSRTAELTTKFTQNLLAETKRFELVVDDEADLAGLPSNLVDAARRRAQKKGRGDAWVFGLDRTTFEPFMTYSRRRELRRRLLDAYRSRGATGAASDNRELVLEIVRRRAERARILGYESHAHYVLDRTMAKTPETVEKLLLEFWQRGLERAHRELAEMQAIADRDGIVIEAWDWWYYAEKLREEKYAFDESQMQPYFKLENVRAGAFHVAEKLFGVTFERVDNVATWHDSVEAFEVRELGGRFLGLFLVDDYARDSKKVGAWMNTFREASNVDGHEIRPIVINVNNLIEPAEGEAVLLKFDDVETVFHEFGHALHGLLTRVRYQRFSGTSGSPRDWVELPSQFLEHYAIEPEVLAVYARHYETGEVIPQELVEKLRQARTHNQGFKTTEYVAAALLDLAWHVLDVDEAGAIDDVRAFEKEVFERYGFARNGLIDRIEPRYRSPCFAHAFTSPIGYSSGYYGYLFSEVLDADGFAAFQEAGDVFDPELARRLAEHVYRPGYVAPGDVLYRRFRGADPKIEPLLRMRGFDTA